MAKEEQLELDLDEDEADTRIYVEDLTLTSDRVLAQAIGKFEKVFIIGVNSEDGAAYFSNHGEIAYWLFWLERAKLFMMRNAE